MSEERPSLDELIEDLIKVGSADRKALLAAFKRAVSYYPQDEVWQRLRARKKIVSLASVRGWCGCRACRITREAWKAGSARQTLDDFIAAHAPPNYHVEPWVSLAWIAAHGSPMAQRQAKSTLVHLRHRLSKAEAAE